MMFRLLCIFFLVWQGSAIANLPRQPTQRYGDFTFAATNQSLADGQNSFSIVAQKPGDGFAANSLVCNLPSATALKFGQNGNLTNDGTRSFGYSADNQLTNIFVAGNWRSVFVYDGLGRRRIARDYTWQGSQWGRTNEVRYVYDGMLPIQELDTNNNVLVTYTRGPDFSGSLADAGGIGGLLARTDANGSTFYHADGAGNITALIDANQNVAARYLYSAFGDLISRSGPLADPNLIRFSSKPIHRQSGTYDFLYRQYLPNLGRFSAQDPIRETGGLNLYGFAGNNPVGNVDPFGLTEASPNSLIGSLFAPLVGAVGRGVASAFDLAAMAIYPAPAALPDYSQYALVRNPGSFGGPGLIPLGPPRSSPLLNPDAARKLLDVAEGGAAAALLLSPCKGARAAKTGADSALQGARLGEHLRQLETYGQAGFKELENGSVRYYGNLKPATTPGEMSGARLVREWTPETGAKRTWLETLDQSGTVRSVRPETGGPKVHYIFDANGNYIGAR